MNDGSYWIGYLKGRRGYFLKDYVEFLFEGKCYILILNALLIRFGG